MNPPRCARVALILGAALLSVVALTLVSASILLLMGAGPQPAVFPVAAFATAGWVILWILRTEEGSKWPLIATILGVVTAIVALSMIVAPLVLDATYDGQWYHQEAVLQLAAGWNPVERDLTPAEVSDDHARAAINGHAKGSWICGSILYRLTNRIEHNKVFSLVLLVAAGCLAFAAMVGFADLTRTQAALVAVVMACNPVAITQLLNAQVDGDLASVVLIIIASLAVHARFRSKLALAVLTTALVVGFGLKITAPLVFAGVVAAGLAPLIARRVRLAPVLAALAIGAVVGLLGTPFAPYLTNTLRHGHPLYPAMGPESITLIKARPHGRLRTLTVSVLSKSRQFPNAGEAVEHLLDGQGLKLPGTFDRDEVKVFAMPDVRVGGFGPLFGAVLLLATAASIAAGWRWLVLAVSIAGPLLVSVLVFPYPWIARLVPHLWLVPLVVLPLTLSNPRRPSRVLGWLTLIIAAGNLLLITVGHLYGVLPHSEMLRTRISELGQRKTDVRLHLGRYRSNRARLMELGVRFTEVDDRHFDLSTYLGSPKPRVLALETTIRDGVDVVVLELAEPDTVTHHRVTVISTPDGRRKGAMEHRLLGGRGEVPLPPGGYLIELAACNALGCGPPIILESTIVAVMASRLEGR